jgi:hypothetical protein
MNAFIIAMYGIVTASFLLASSGCMTGIAVPITEDTIGTAVAMTGTIGGGMEIVTATGVTHDQTGGTRSGKEIN